MVLKPFWIFNVNVYSWPEISFTNLQHFCTVTLPSKMWLKLLWYIESLELVKYEVDQRGIWHKETSTSGVSTQEHIFLYWAMSFATDINILTQNFYTISPFYNRQNALRFWCRKRADEDHTFLHIKCGRCTKRACNYTEIDKKCLLLKWLLKMAAQYIMSQWDAQRAHYEYCNGTASHSHPISVSGVSALVNVKLISSGEIHENKTFRFPKCFDFLVIQTSKLSVIIWILGVSEHFFFCGGGGKAQGSNFYLSTKTCMTIWLQTFPLMT